jgi:hypothetical protein
MFITSRARYNIIRTQSRIQYDTYLALYYDTSEEIAKLHAIIDSDPNFKPFFYHTSKKEPETHCIELHFPRLSTLEQSFHTLMALCAEHNLTAEKVQIENEFKTFNINKITAELNKKLKGITLHCSPQTIAPHIASYIEAANHYECAIEDQSGDLLIMPRDHVKNQIDTIPEKALYGRRWCSYDSLEDLTRHLRDIHYKLWRTGHSEVLLVKTIAALYLLEELLESGETGRVSS